MIRFSLSVLMVLATIAMVAQTPFLCRGEYYLTWAPPDGTNSLFTVDIDQASEQVTFNPIPGFDRSYDLNAMGYRITDNFIYIVEQDRNNSLMRIDASGRVTRLRAMNELPELAYFSGACTPDGDYLVISGNPNGFLFGSANINLVYIDLRDPGYPTRIVELDNNRYLFFDMAFDPFTGILYGYDSNERTLVRINPDNGTVRSVGSSGQVCNAMGALFFDAFGNLYGYGELEGTGDQTTFFAIDKETGRLDPLTSGQAADRSDGCACPYTIKMVKDVFPRNTIPCGEVNYTFTIANASAIARDQLDFRDIMPEGFEVLEILRNPFGGNRVETGNANELIIEDMVIPLGVDSMIVRVRIGEGAAGVYKNQAVLDDLPEALGGFTLSDDPSTLAAPDSTSLFVQALEVDLTSQNKLICPGDSLVLMGERTDVQYIWMDRFEGQQFVISEPGTYWVEARSLCEVRRDTIDVEFAPPLFVDVGPDQQVNLGDSFNVQPFVEGLAPLYYSWTTTDDPATIRCDNCLETTITPFNNSTLTLTVQDRAGCSVSDALNIAVDRNAYIWIANAFSPNGDGVNDYFYVQGRFPYRLSDFEIYTRWGQRVFHNEQLLVNDEFAGWDGMTNGEPMNPGVYVYRAVLSFIDGTRIYKTGDVTLIR